VDLINQQRPKILICDDLPANLTALQAVLRSEDFEILEAANGAEAIKIVETNDIAVLLLGAMMPILDGYGTAREIQRRFPQKDIPIIFLTAMSLDDSYVRQGYELGAVDYISKPFDSEILLKKLKFHVDRFLKTKQLEIQVNYTKSILQSVYDAFVSIDDRGFVTDWNPRAETLFGWKKEEVLGKLLSSLIIPPRFKAAHEKGFAHFLITGQGPVIGKQIEMPALNRAGKEIPVELTISAIRVGESYSFTAFLRDISERKRAENVQAVQLQVTRVLADAMTLNDGIQDSLKVMCAGLGWHFGALWLVDQPTQTLRTDIVWHIDKPEFARFEAESRKLSLRRGQGLLGRIWDSQKALLFDDLLTDPNFLRSAPAAIAGLRGGLAFPVRTGDEFIGIIEFLSQSPVASEALFLETATDFGSRIGSFYQRKKAEDELKKSEDRLRRMSEELIVRVEEKTKDLAQSRDQLDIILKGISDGITVIDENGQFIYANETGARMSGFSSVQEFLNTPAVEIMQKFEIMDELGKPFPVSDLPGRLALTGVENPPEVIVRFRIKDTGEERWSIVRASPIFDQTRKVRMAVSIFKDFTDRKRTEDAIRYMDMASRILSASLDYEQTLAQLAKLAVPKIADWCSITILDPGSPFPRTLAVEHSDPEKLDLAKKFQERYPPDWTAPTGVPNVIRTGVSEIYTEIPEELLRKGSQSEEHFREALELGLKSAMIVPLSSRGSTFGAITFIAAESGRRFSEADLGFAEELARRAGVGIDNARLFAEAEQEKNKSNEALQKVEKLVQEAESANQTKSLFLANMSHEIRTPLGVILGFTDLLIEPSLSSSDRMKYAEIINRNGTLLTQLIDDILDLSKVEAGHFGVERLPVSLANVLSDVSTVMKVRATNKGLGYSVISDSPIPDLIYTDPTRLRQILLNIIGNAIKFTDRGSVKVSLKIESDMPGKIFIAVEDTGLGIEPESGNRLFEWFTQADASTTRKFGGTGLGLALSRKFARALGGDLELVSSGPTGTKFVISISIDAATETSSTSKQQNLIEENRPATPTPHLAGLRVLVVDDSADNRLLIESILRRKGIIVETADNGRMGVDMALGKTYDIILMDIQMPVLDGLQATAELRKRGYKKPIVALTAHAMNEEREKTRFAGANAHLTKPIEIATLLSTVAKYSGADS